MKLPQSFETYTSALLGNEVYRYFVSALNQEPTPFIRLNSLKQVQLSPHLAVKPVAWYANGYALENRPTFTFDPMLHGGAYYVQEASSMFLAHVLKQHVHQAVDMLDMCAAPGGKSTLARMVLPLNSTLMCNEPMRDRAQILAENVWKCGHPAVIVTNNYPEDYVKSGLKFDVILCDVPCSGEGMFRKNENAIAQWSMENVAHCQTLQREIVANAWQCLQPGGILIYSTCTFNTKENEENVAWICQELGAEVLPVALDKQWNIQQSLLIGFEKPVYRFIPGSGLQNNSIEGEGLFMAVLRKEGTLQAQQRKHLKAKKHEKNNTIPQHLPTHWIENAHEMQCFFHENHVFCVPQNMAAIYQSAAKSLKIVLAGVGLATQKGKDFIPHHALALSICRNKTAFPTVELTYNDAINYLRKENITLPSDTPKGWIIVTFDGISLGFIKHLGNRSNNFYPTEWRIRSSYLPKEQPKIVDIQQQ